MLALATALLLSGSGPAAAFDEIDDELAEADRSYAAEVSDLAAQGRAKRLEADAEKLAHRVVPRTTDRFVIYHVADATSPEESPDETVGEAAAEWRQSVRALGQRRAKTLFSLAEKAAKARRKSLAYELLWETLYHDGDHPEARRRLDYEKTSRGWARPFSAKQIRTGRTWNARFGWIEAEDVARWEAGERNVGGRWVTAEQDARRHSEIRSAWQIETDHFIVTTNHSREEAARLAVELERLHRAWQQVFLDYWMTDAEFERAFGLVKRVGPQTARPARSNRHRVVCYRDRDEYVQALSSSQPRIGMSLGVYLEAGRASYFFAGEDQHRATVYHEATHQLFKESRPTVKLPGREHGLWLIEGAACYMESLRRGEGYDVLGEQDQGRFPAALEKIAESFYVPLGELSAMSSDELQSSRDIARIYSQSAGLTTFLLHGAGGMHRDATLRTLAACYAGKASANTLARECQRSFQRLDEEYLEFIRQLK